MKNKKMLGILIDGGGALVSLLSFFKARSFNLGDIPISSTEWQILKMQFKGSNMTVPFIFGIILMVVGLIIFIKATLKKNK